MDIQVPDTDITNHPSIFLIKLPQELQKFEHVRLEIRCYSATEYLATWRRLDCPDDDDYEWLDVVDFRGKNRQYPQLFRRMSDGEVQWWDLPMISIAEREINHEITRALRKWRRSETNP